MPLVGRTSSCKSIVVSDSAPSRARTIARYSFVRMTKRPSAARSVVAHDVEEQPVGAQRPVVVAGRDEQ